MIDINSMTVEDFKKLSFQIETKDCNCRNILIVDDEPYNQVVFQKMLTKIDKEMIITKANDGKDAIDIFQKKIRINTCQFCDFFKFIIMDLNMPDIDGANAAKKILEITKKNSLEKQIDRNYVKIIAASAYTDLDSRNRCLEAGMIRYLNKPLKIMGLTKTLYEIGCLTIKNSDF